MKFIVSLVLTCLHAYSTNDVLPFSLVNRSRIGTLRVSLIRPLSRFLSQLVSFVTAKPQKLLFVPKRVFFLLLYQLQRPNIDGDHVGRRLNHLLHPLYCYLPNKIEAHREFFKCHIYSWPSVHHFSGKITEENHSTALFNRLFLI